MLQKLFKAVALSLALATPFFASKAWAQSSGFDPGVAAMIYEALSEEETPSPHKTSSALHVASNQVCQREKNPGDTLEIRNMRTLTGLDVWRGASDRVWILVPSAFNRDAFLKKMITIRENAGLSKDDLPFYSPRDPATQVIVTKAHRLTERVVRALSSEEASFKKLSQESPATQPSGAVAFLRDLTGMDAWLTSYDDKVYIDLHVPATLPRCEISLGFAEARKAAGIDKMDLPLRLLEMSSEKSGAFCHEILIRLSDMTPEVMMRLGKERKRFRTLLKGAAPVSPATPAFSGSRQMLDGAAP